MKFPKMMWLRMLAFSVLASTALTSCSVQSDGPVSAGSTHGSLGSVNMADYYYRKAAGWVYTYENVQRIYNTNGTLASTLTGANDVVTTLGFDGFAPNNDSLFRIEIAYRVLSTYAGRAEVNIRYICNGNSQNGAFIDGSNTITGETSMGKRPRPVSTDTIIAGVIGRVRTMCDDFSNNGTYTYQKDTIWFSAHADSVFIWERFPGQTNLTRSRLLFCRDFTYNSTWHYDLVDDLEGGYHTTAFQVKDADMSLSTPAGSFAHVVKIAVTTPEVYDNMPINETKYFACGAGFVKEFDEWYVTTNGLSRNKQDYTHTLVSLVHP
jgi:hypothetical protein